MWDLFDGDPAFMAAGVVSGLGVILMLDAPRRGGKPQIIAGAVVVLLGMLVPNVWP
jgi:hypothetical protein